MTKLMLVKYLELGEQIKALTEQQDEIKAIIKAQFPDGGISELYGINFGCDAKSRTGYDTKLMIKDFGSDIMKKYETFTTYLSVFVKPTSKSLKG